MKRLFLLSLLLLMLAACDSDSDEESAASTEEAPTLTMQASPEASTPTEAASADNGTDSATFAPAEAGNVQRLIPQVISVRPHDPDSFTQGLLLYEGVFYESAGRYGQSNLRRVDPQTGEVLQRVDVPEAYFAEGLALVDDRLIQLTWREGTAFVYDRETFDLLETYRYETEGWGLCYDGEVLYLSDGSPNLFVHDAETFELLNTIPVTRDGLPVFALNELECVGDSIYANVWQTFEIVQIDKATGQVTATIDASSLLTPEEIAALPPNGVLNGIAYDPQNEVFYITGKLWPSLFEVRFVEG